MALVEYDGSLVFRVKKGIGGELTRNGLTTTTSAATAATTTSDDEEKVVQEEGTVPAGEGSDLDLMPLMKTLFEYDGNRGVRITFQRMEMMVKRTWPAWQKACLAVGAAGTAGILMFENTLSQGFCQLASELIFAILSYLPSCEVAQLAALSLAFAAPQPHLSCTSLVATAVHSRGLCMTFLENPEPTFLWNHAGPDAPLLRCSITRLRRGLFSSATEYQMHEEGDIRGNERLLLVAVRTTPSCISIFNVCQGYVRGRLRRNCANHIADCHSTFSKREFVVRSAHGKAEIAAILFHRQAVGDRPKPRKFCLAVPRLSACRTPMSVRRGLLAHLKRSLGGANGVGGGGGGGVGGSDDDWDESDDEIDEEGGLSRIDQHFTFRNRWPRFDLVNGQGAYRLDFNGRVAAASVKNFQVEDAHGELICQFGRKGNDRDHFALDYRAPLNAAQAFCVALANF